MRAWRSRIGRVLRPPPMQGPLALDETSPIDADEELRSERQEAALALVDPDTHGYVLLMLKRTPGGWGDIRFYAHVKRDWFPAFRRAAERMIVALR